MGRLSGEDDDKPYSSTYPLLVVLSSNKQIAISSDSPPGASSPLNNISHWSCCLVSERYCNRRADPRSSTGTTRLVNAVFVFLCIIHTHVSDGEDVDDTFSVTLLSWCFTTEHAAASIMHILLPEMPTAPPQTVFPISLAHTSLTPVLEPNNPLPDLLTLRPSSLGGLDPLADDGITGVPNAAPLTSNENIIDERRRKLK
jgi:hypothetical protein